MTQTSQHPLDFFFGGYAAGHFETAPTKSGRWRYMPYRGHGYQTMHAAIEANGFARCTMRIDDRGFSFVVTALLENHFLAIEL